MTDPKFDVDEAIENMARAAMVDLDEGNLTLSAVICVYDDGHASHGGLITTGPAEAIHDAEGANEAAPEGHPCVYLPVAIGLPMDAWLALRALIEGVK